MRREGSAAMNRRAGNRGSRDFRNTSTHAQKHDRRDAVSGAHCVTSAAAIYSWRFLLVCATGAVILGGSLTFPLVRMISTATPAIAPREHVTLDALLAMTSDRLEHVDIAAVNLACAAGLPGAEELNVAGLLATLDDWAARVKRDTDRHLYRLSDPRYAEHYKHSEAVFRMEMLCQVLQEDLGVHYNLERARNVNFTNSRDLFIHGMLGSDNGGTCVSMPVLYTAVARRLGYPVSLVRAKSHIFCRWDGRGERWNIEATAAGGMESFPDKHYREWPEPISDAEVERGEYLKTLTQTQALAAFLTARGHCLQDTGRLREAQLAYAHAHQLDPVSRDYFGFLLDAVRQEIGSYRSGTPDSGRSDSPDGG